MSILILGIKTIIAYVLVAIIFRVMGKREVGQMGTFDLVVFLLIADMVSISLEDTDKFLYHLIPVFILVILQIIISRISLKNAKFRNILDGKPTMIIKNGIINFKNMVDQRYTLDDLLLQLREKDIRSIDEVDYAILETNGRLSVFKKDDKDKNTYPMPIILDGVVEFDNLYSVNKTKKWLLDILLKQNVSASDVFYAFCKDNNLYIIKKDEVKK